ncbi:hypothetical protein evm_005432 [Chilo suppressalis]|nr:hypothetical protein evm_005432 [Chilo suppressalis]
MCRLLLKRTKLFRVLSIDFTHELECLRLSNKKTSTSQKNAVKKPLPFGVFSSSSQSPVARDEDYVSQLQRMHEMGLLDDALNVRALLICSGDVNAAINLVFSGAIGDD